MKKGSSKTEEGLANKTLYKIFLLVLKVIPIIIAFLCIINTSLSVLEILAPIISCIGGTSLLTLLFLYISSYVFKFCVYHRMFLHYILLSQIINVIDFYININITDLKYLLIHYVIFGIFLFIILYLYVTTDKKDASSNSR